MPLLTPADLRSMLRADAVGLALGLVVVAAGLLLALLWAAARRRATSLRTTHARRLVAWTVCGFVRRASVGPDLHFPPLLRRVPAVWEYVAAALTYTVPLPIVLFVRTFVPTWRRFSTVVAVILSTFAAYAIASDIMLRRPNSSRTLNNLIAIALLAVWRTLEFRELEENGLALGFSQQAEYDELEQPLEPEDRLLLYTDGLIEAWNAGEELFGIERVKTSIAATATLPPGEAADALLTTMNAWSRQPAADDLTIVVVDWTRRNLIAASSANSVEPSLR